jgi:cytochrome P450
MKNRAPRRPDEIAYDPLVHTPSDGLYERYEWLLENEPVFHNELRDVWCIARYDDVLSAARDWQRFSNSQGVDLDVPGQFFGKGDFLDSDPPRHDVLRQLVRLRFTPRNIKHLETLVQRRVDDLLARCLGDAELDIATEFAWELPIWVISRLLGLDPDSYAEVKGALTKLTTKEQGAAAPSGGVLDGLATLQKHLVDEAERKRAAPGDDLLTELIGYVDAGTIEIEDLVGISLLMFVAGSETAASVITSAIYLLDAHRDQQALLRTGTVGIDQAIEEIVRFESPIQYLCRTTTCDVAIAGTTIPTAARVALLYGAANRDPRRFAAPNRFDLRREAKRHLGFGNGIHFCLGAPLARLEARLALTAFLERTVSYAVVGEPQRLANHLIRGITHLPISITATTATRAA